MDTSRASDYTTVNRLLGSERVSFSSTTPTAWYGLLERIMKFRGGLIAELPVPFVPIGDLMSGSGKYEIYTKIPRGMTKFKKGLASTTRVIPVRYLERRFGTRLEENSNNWSKNIIKELLLLPPKKNQGLRWAVWVYHYDLKKFESGTKLRFEKTATSSVLEFVDKVFVMTWLEKKPHLFHGLLDRMYLQVHHHTTNFKSIMKLHDMLEHVERHTVLSE